MTRDTRTNRVPHHTSSRLRRAVPASVLAAVVLGGCSQMSPQTTQLDYAASDGVMIVEGDLAVRNLLLVADEQGQQATVVGSLVNSSGDPMQIQLGAEGSQLSQPVEVPAGDAVVLSDEDPRIEVPIDAQPGTMTTFVIRTGSQDLTLEVPVLDGTLAEYSTLTPGAAPTAGEEATVPEEPAATQAPSPTP